MADQLNWNPWAARCPAKGVSYVIGRVIDPDGTTYVLDRLDNLNDSTRLGAYSSMTDAQTAAQADADA